MVLLNLFHLALGLILLLALLHMVVRIVRHFYKFPMPYFMANLIDHPLRRLIQPPDTTPLRHGIEPGMTVLDVGPGNGTYTLATARRVGDEGKVVAIDIEPRMMERVMRRAQAEGITNIEARVGDVCDLPFDDGAFDVIYMITVIGEIPSFEDALRELRRVLSPSGMLAFSELFPDPDYPWASTLIRKTTMLGFKLKKKIGNFFYYTLVFEKD